MVIAVTADIVGSRELADRADAQRLLDEAIARVEEDVPRAVRPLRPTVGDEQQGVYADLSSALGCLLLLQLALPDAVQCRFGVGVGDIEDVPARGGAISEGPAWWAARSAIEKVHALEQRAAPRARTWVAAAEGEDVPGLEWINAGLLARDEIVGTMSERTRRLAYGRCFGRTQRSLAGAEGITQPAVSQALSSSGAAAVVEGFRLLGLTG